MIRIDPDAIGPAIGDLRRMLGLRMSDLAEDAGLRTSQLSYWERGLRTPDIRSLVKLARALGYDIALVPLIETTPQAALSPPAAAEPPDLGVPGRPGGAQALTEAPEAVCKDAWPNGVRCPVVDDWCPGDVNGNLCAQPCDPEEHDPEEQS